MTAPRITFRELWPGSSILEARLGAQAVGRVQAIGGAGSWICCLPTPTGLPLSQWRDAKTPQAAQHALIAHVLGWLRLAGLIEATE